MYTRYEPNGMGLSDIPKLDGVIPAGAYQLVRGFGSETGAEDSGFMTIHDIWHVTAFENSRFYSIPIFITTISLEMERLPLVTEYFLR